MGVSNCKVSVIIPSYNRFVSLQAALASVFRQSHTNLEAIVVDDGSSDPAYYSARSDRVRWVDLKPPTRETCGRPCPGHARNAGIALATGDYVAFLDDDDAWLPEKLSRQLSAMTQSGYRISCTEGLMGDGLMASGRRYPVYHREFYSNFCIGLFERTGRAWTGRLPSVLCRDLIAAHNFIITSSVVVDRGLLRDAGPFRCLPPGEEDYDLWLRCLEHVDCLHLDTPLTYYDGRLTKRRRETPLHHRILRRIRAIFS